MKKHQWLIAICMLFSLFLFIGCGDPPAKGKEENTTPESGQVLDQGNQGTDGAAETAPEPSQESTQETVPEEPTPEPVVEESPPEPEPKKIETKLSKNTALAGETVTVTCEVTDQFGNKMTVPTEPFVDPQPQGNVTDTEVTIQKVGTYKIACQLKQGSLKDESPEELVVSAGTPATVDTEVKPASVKAGESATVTCIVQDQHGNPVIGAKTTVTVTPKEKITVAADKVSGTKAGKYQVACEVTSGAKDSTPAELEITPGLPAKIEVTADPKQGHYEPDDTITLKRKVFDKYGNEIPNAKVKVTVKQTSGYDKSAFPDNIAFTKDGVYEVTIAIDGATEGGKPVSKTLTFKVDGNGPKIVITYPVRAAMIKTTTNKITVKGKVTDLVSGVSSLTINGKTVKLDSSGNFSYPLTTRWGLNLLNVEAKDGVGNLGKRLQSFLWSNRYHPMGTSPIAKGLIGRLNQKAIDDRDRRTLNDLASILEKVINGIDIDALVPSTLTSGSKRYKIPPFGPTISISYSVTKNGKVTIGKREIRLTARNGGISFWGRFHNVRVPLRGKATRFLNKSFTITGSYVDVAGDINVSYSNGKVQVSVPKLTANVSRISVRAFSGFFSFLNGTVTNILRSRIKSALENAIKKAIPDPISKFISGFKLDTSFKLPTILGGKSIRIIGKLDSLKFDSAGGTLGLATGLSAAKGIPSGKLGTPMGTQSLPTWSTSYAFGVGLAFNTLNHALATMWYAGAFKQDLTSLVGSLSSKLPIKLTGVKLFIDAQLPLVLHKGSKGHALEAGLGDTLLTITGDIPSVGKLTAKAYLTASFGGSLSITPANEIQIKLDTKPLLFAVEVVQISGISGNLSNITKIVETYAPVIAQALSFNALQKFPIPSIDLSSFGGKYGIPKGTKLALDKATLIGQWDYAKVTGNLKNK